MLRSYTCPVLLSILCHQQMTMLLGISTLICGYTDIPHAPSVRVSADDHVTQDIHVSAVVDQFTRHIHGLLVDVHIYSMPLSADDQVTWDSMDHPQRSLASNLGFNGSSTETSS